MNPIQAFIDALTVALQAAFVPHGYTVEQREPAEGELVADANAKQIFITTEGFESPEGVADMGQSTRIRVPVMVACVMQRPSTAVLSAKTLRRRMTILQACQRAVRDFDDPSTLVYLVQEQPTLIEGYYVSITQLDVQHDLDAEEQL